MQVELAIVELKNTWAPTAIILMSTVMGHKQRQRTAWPSLPNQANLVLMLAKRKTRRTGRKQK